MLNSNNARILRGDKFYIYVDIFMKYVLYDIKMKQEHAGMKIWSCVY
jgi:hypothetical protein